VALTLRSNDAVDDAAGWRDLIRRRLGLLVRSSREEVLADLLRGRMEERGVTSYTSYCDLLDAEGEGGAEWTAIVEGLVSRETSFFRHPASFELLRTRLLPDLRRRPDVGGNQLALLSAGCSTGEEAYSLAMIAGADDSTRTTVSVTGIDISRRSIELARRGRYSRRAIAAVPDPYRRRFIAPVSESGGRQYEVSHDVRRQVRFIRMNLYTACRMFATYDVIFCQNVLIYFSPSAALHLLSMLGACLNLGGYLVPGPGEAPFDLPGLEAMNVGGVKAFRRVGRTLSEVRQ
jgi:type IV pilus assembly protein PilK